jgi:NAD(P)-dependent dehydrogenase (short-subunit alcohol dehydrogenase family)
VDGANGYGGVMSPTPSTPRQGRAVLVTGASSGIGRAVALQLAERGDSLVLLARRTVELEQVESECRKLGSPDTVVATADVADAQAVDEAIAVAAEQLGPLDSVVHAAGIAAYGRFDEIPRDVFDRVYQVNVAGTANVARSALRHFDAHGRKGDLVLFGSVVGRISTPYLSPYVSSKWAVHGLARTLQAEQTPGGHRISLVEPGGVDTSIYEKAASYLGVQGKPPPPVYDAATVARATVALLDHPRRERSVGLLNPLMSLGFRTMPAVYDLIVGPLMSRLALADEPVHDHPGYAFEPTAEPATDGPGTHHQEYA